MDCMGERISGCGIIAMVSHGDIMGLMLFFFMFVIGRKSFSWMAKAKWFVMGSLGEMVCHTWNGEMVCHRWLG